MTITAEGSAVAYLRDYLLRDAARLGSRRLSEGRFGEESEGVTSGWASRSFSEVCWEVKRRGAPVLGVWEDPACERGEGGKRLSCSAGHGGAAAAAPREQVGVRGTLHLADCWCPRCWRRAACCC